MLSGGAIARLFVSLGLQKQEFDSGAADVRGKTAALKTSLQDVSGASGLMEKALAGAATLGLGVLAKKAAEAAWELGVLGLREQDVERNLIAFAGSAQRAREFTEAVRRASGGAADTMLAESTAARFLQMGLASTTGEMNTYIEGATRLGDQNMTAGQRIQSMSDFLKNQNLMMADNFGLSRSYITNIRDQLIATQGLSKEQATAVGIQQAINAQLEQMGPRAEDGAISVDRLDATMADLKLTIGEGLAPVVGTLAEGLNNELRPAVDGLADAIDEALPEIVQFIDTLESGKDKWQWLADVMSALNQPVAFGLEQGIGLGKEMAGDVDKATEAWDRLTLAQENYQVALESGKQWVIDFSLAELQDARAAYYELTTGTESAIGAYEDMRQQSIDTAAAVDISAQSFLDAAGAAAQAEFAMRSAAGRTADVYEYRRSLLSDERDDLADIIALNESVPGIIEDSAKTAEKAWKESISSQQRAYDELRGTIQRALSATSVTAEDMGLAGIGAYIDKWDENARRLDAVAARGFAELDAHPDWAAMLKIPPEVIASGEQALKDWANRAADAVRGLERPDLLNIDAAVKAVQDELNRQAAVELSLDLVTKAAVEKGLVGGEDAKAQVARMLGLEQAIPVSLAIGAEEKKAFVEGIGSLQIPVELTAGLGGKEGEESGLGSGVFAGFQQSLRQIAWTQTISNIMSADIAANKARLYSVGEAVGAPLWDGMLSRLRGSGIVNHIIREVMDALTSEVAGK